MVLYNNITDIVVNQVPFRHGQKKIGVEEGPEKLIEYGLLKKIEKRGLKIVENNIIKIEIDEKLPNLELCSRMCQKLADKIDSCSKKNRFCLNVGGDHSLGTGSISGLLRAYPDLCVIWIDAHTDINRVDTSPSGSVHGMPVSFVLDDKREKSQAQFPSQYKWCKERKLSASKLAYFGIRQADPGEIETVKECNILAYDMLEIERKGIPRCLEEALKSIDPESKCPIHVSFDIDSLDPSLTPSTGTPVPGGINLREILYIGETIFNTGRLAGMDIVEFNPKVCSDTKLVELTAKNTFRVMNAFLGKQRPSFH